VPSYEVQTAPIRSHRRAVAIAVVAGLVIVAAAVAGTLVRGPAPRDAAARDAAARDAAARDAAAHSAAPVRDPERPSGVSTAISPAPISPDAITCEGLPNAECLTAVEAAERAIGDVGVAVQTAQAWPTLLCRDDLDCPRPLLRASEPVGSVVLTFADIGAVWVNVFRIPEPNRLNENREVLAGRVVRWLPAGS
jgi:hypothetical protein